MDDTISREQVIATIDNFNVFESRYDQIKLELMIRELPPALEPLTDKEQRIFLAAMGRERKVCKEVDDQYTHEPYEVLLTKVCSEIERKVKKALWS